MKSNIKYIIFFAALCMLCAAFVIFRTKHTKNYRRAEIRIDGEIERVIDLDSIEEPYEFKINSADGGYNIIRAEKGRIAAIDSDCPDKVCVNMGYISDGSVPIVCLPHKLSVVLTNEGEVDAVT